jgi:hypothetical protein
MKKALIVAGLIGAAGLVAAAPASADSTVSCSPMPLCTINGDVQEFQKTFTEFFTKGPQQFHGSVTDFVIKGPKEFHDSVRDFVTEGPKTFRDSITNPGGAEG